MTQAERISVEEFITPDATIFFSNPSSGILDLEQGFLSRALLYTINGTWWHGRAEVAISPELIREIFYSKHRSARLKAPGIDGPIAIIGVTVNQTQIEAYQMNGNFIDGTPSEYTIEIHFTGTTSTLDASVTTNVCT